MGISNILAKTVGVGALWLTIKDAHRVGIAAKNKNPQAKIAQSLPDAYIKSKELDMGTMPTVVANMKDRWMNFRLNETVTPAIYGVTGYLGGAVNGLINNVIPLSLGIGALAFKKTGGKICAALLGLGALKMFLFDVCGFGKYKRL